MRGAKWHKNQEKIRRKHYRKLLRKLHKLGLEIRGRLTKARRPKVQEQT